MKEREEKVKRSADKQKKGRKNRDVLEKEEGSINLSTVASQSASFVPDGSRWRQV